MLITMGIRIAPEVESSVLTSPVHIMSIILSIPFTSMNIISINCQITERTRSISNLILRVNKITIRQANFLSLAISSLLLRGLEILRESR